MAEPTALPERRAPIERHRASPVRQINRAPSFGPWGPALCPIEEPRHVLHAERVIRTPEAGHVASSPYAALRRGEPHKARIP